MTGRSRLFSVVGALALIVSAGVVVLASPATAQQGVVLSSRVPVQVLHDLLADVAVSVV